MLSVISGVAVNKNRLKVKSKIEKPDTANIIFKLHYVLTTGVLLAFTALLGYEQFTKKKIECTHADPTDTKKILEHVLNTFCFFLSTYTVADHHNITRLKDVAQPGVGPHTKEDDIIRHNYYQWVPYVLFLQAMCFYLPHYVWKQLEGGQILNLVKGFNIIEMLNEGKMKKEEEKVMTSFDKRLEIYNSWTYRLILCEAMNFANVIIQIFVTDRFLNGQFLNLGTHVYDNWVDGLNPLDRAFPKTAKCTFQKFGPSGSLQTQDALCVLTLNVINEKIFISLWYWYIILGIASGLVLVHRVLSYVFYSTSKPYNRTVFNLSMHLKPDKDDLDEIMNKINYNQWFFLANLVENIDGRLAKELLKDMAQSFRKKKEDTGNIPELRRDSGSPTNYHRAITVAFDEDSESQKLLLAGGSKK